MKWETDWLKRMQEPDGSAALKVGEIVYPAAAPPSSDRNTRYYIPSCTSGTIAVAGMFAHAAYVFGGVGPLAAEAADLKTRAIAAWENYQRAPAKQTHCDTNVVHAGNADWTEEEQNGAAVTAAIYLFAITGSPTYDAYVKAHLRDAKPYHDIGWSRYNPEQGEALLAYTTLPRADGDLRRTILADKQGDSRSATQIYGFRPDDDLYRDFMFDSQYHWGSNNPRAAYGNTNMDVITYHIATGDVAEFRLRALETLHYFHGVNPLAIVYLSNMGRYGASRSVNELFHGWYAPGTQWSDALASACGPAPGYVPGGPNVHAADNGVPTWLAPPTGQPAQKSYKERAGHLLPVRVCETLVKIRPLTQSRPPKKGNRGNMTQRTVCEHLRLVPRLPLIQTDRSIIRHEHHSNPCPVCPGRAGHGVVRVSRAVDAAVGPVESSP